MLCESYNLQYGTNFIALSPTNLYGSNDKFDLEKAHVMPALLRKMHLAKLLNEGHFEELLKDLNVKNLDEAKTYLAKFGVSEESVEIWGDGTPTREFIHSEDLAKALKTWQIWLKRWLALRGLYFLTRRVQMVLCKNTLQAKSLKI